MRIPYGYLAVLKMMPRAAYDKNLKPAARRVLMILAGHSDTHGGCWPSVAKMADKLGMSRAAVIHQLKALEASNYIRKDARFDPNSGRQMSNLYTLNIHDAELPQDVTPSVKSEDNRGGKVCYITPEGDILMSHEENT